MISRALFLHADFAPEPGVEKPGPTQTYKNPRVSIRERELPALEDFSIRVELLAVGICGTDLHLVAKQPETGYITCSAPVLIPQEGRVIGHEGVGRVVAVGRHVVNIHPGDHVTFESLVACQRCERCRRGNFNQCRHARLLGLEEDGLFATFADVPGSVAHVIDAWRNDSDLAILACLEPAAVAYLACQNARLRGGEKVVVFGGGPIGLYSAIAAAGVFGASSVAIVDPVPFRREFAVSWCDNVFDVEEFFDAPPSEIDVVIESSGVLQNVTRVFPSINANGRAILLGRCGQPLMIHSIDHMITNAISVMGSRGHLGGAFHALLALHAAGKFPLEAPVTKTIRGLEELGQHLVDPGLVLNENCKVLARFDRAG
jgi:D-xylulose reductase